MSDKAVGVIQGVALVVMLVCVVAAIVGEYDGRSRDQRR